MQTPNEAPEIPPSLDEFVGLTDLYPKVKNTFPTMASLGWYVRQHRAALAKAGALIFITGRLRFHPEKFQQVAISIGRRAIEERHADE